MITEIRSDRLVVISDLHLGNPFSKAKSRTVEFMKWAHLNNFDIIINGDGFEIAQTSFARLSKDVPEFLHGLKSVTQNGRTVYYVIGNHDILMENFLNDWGGFKLAPFLNVCSHGKRVRVEHGHLYDPFFVSSPRMYEFCTWLAGFALLLSPSLYKGWIAFEKFKSKFFKPQAKAIAGEHPNFMEAATELLNRGFDTVVFGHTHHVGEVDLGDGRKYFNSGSWLIGTPYLEIINGEVALRTFKSRDQKVPGTFSGSQSVNSQDTVDSRRDRQAEKSKSA